MTGGRLADPARALYELLWASHPTAGPRQAEALGFEVIESSHDTYDPTRSPGDDRRRYRGRGPKKMTSTPIRQISAPSRSHPSASNPSKSRPHTSERTTKMPP